MQNFIKILYLLLTIFEPSTKITHSHLFIPKLTLDKIFPRTKLFRPELNRKKKSSPNKKKLPQDYRIYSTHIYIYIPKQAFLATTTRNATKFHQVPHQIPCTKYQNYTSLPTPCDLTLDNNAPPSRLSYPRVSKRCVIPRVQRFFEEQ